MQKSTNSISEIAKKVAHYIFITARVIFCIILGMIVAIPFFYITNLFITMFKIPILSSFLAFELFSLPIGTIIWFILWGATAAILIYAILTDSNK